MLIQSFEDEFDLNEYGDEDCSTPAAPGQILICGGEEGVMEPKWQRMYCKGVGKLLHMTRWSQPDIRNAVQELTKCNGVAKPAHYKAMIQVMHYCVQTRQIGWIIKLKCKWDGKKGTIKVRVSGHSDSTYASDPKDRKSISGYLVEVEDTTMVAECVGQDGVMLSVCEAKTVAGMQCAQEMLFVKKELESIEIEVELPMILRIDCKGAVDLANSWSISGQTCSQRTYLRRPLKNTGRNIAENEDACSVGRSVRR